MKTKVLAVIAFAFFVSLNLKAQCINGTKSYPLYKMGAQLVDELDNEGKEIVRIEYDLVFTSKESFRTLSADWEYTIVAFADDGVKDLNIRVYEYDKLLDKWTLVAEDMEEDASAVVVVQPSQSGSYKVEVIVNEYNEGYNVARYGLMYVHD